MENQTAMKMDEEMVSDGVMHVVLQELTEDVTAVLPEADLAQEAQPYTPPEEKTTALREALEAAISNPIFWENPKRYNRALEAMKVPVSDDRAFQQFYNHARKDLIELACKDAIEKGVVPVMPTEDDICVEAKRRQADKQKAKRKAEKNK